MKTPPMATTVGLALLLAAPRACPVSAFAPYGYQSGNFDGHADSGHGITVDSAQARASELLDDDSYAASMFHDAEHGLVYFTGVTYGTFFDSATDLSVEVRGAMGMSAAEGGRDARRPHLSTGDCFLGILKLPQQTEGPDSRIELIYARRFGTPHNAEACSAVLLMAGVRDGLLQTTAQLKLVLLGHVNPSPLSSAEMNALGPPPAAAAEEGPTFNGIAVAVGPHDGGGRRLGRRSDDRAPQQPRSPRDEGGRALQLGEEGNRGGFLHSVSSSVLPVAEAGRAYGFVADFDLSLTRDERYSATPPPSSAGAGAAFRNAYGALLGGAVLDDAPLVYPATMVQSARDPNQLYVASLRADVGGDGTRNPDYAASAREELDGSLHRRPDATLGGSGSAGAWGAPKYGTNFYVHVQQLAVTPYENLLTVEPTYDEKVKRTMEKGWGFGFKLNDATDVRPSSIVFIKGRTPNDDLLLLGGTTRRGDAEGDVRELDGFVTKLSPPAPSPVSDVTTGGTVEDAVRDEGEGGHTTRRIESTTGRDETVAALCLPPPDPRTGAVEHVYVVGSSAAALAAPGPSQAYIIKMRLDDLGTVWKAHVPSIHPAGIGGDVLGEGCAVTPDGRDVYLAGTIDGGSAIDTGVSDPRLRPIGGSTDVFVVSFDAGFGHVRWARQLGTLHEDKLARGGGVACDNEGNAIVMGSTRGALQRSRPEGNGGTERDRGGTQSGALGRLASDVFLMSLSREDGEYINAPYASGGDTAVSSPVSASIPEPVAGASEGMSAPTAAFLFVVVIGLAAALFFIAVRRRNSDTAKQRGNIERMWDEQSRGGFSVGSARPRGGLGTRAHAVATNFSRRVRGYKDPDDEHSSVVRNATWMSNEYGETAKDGSDAYSTGSGSSKGSGSSRRQENDSFLASLRQEANLTMNRMIKDPKKAGVATDPRLDGGASIKSLLRHYREGKKEVFFDGKTEGEGSGDGEEGDTNTRTPPPPHGKNKDEHGANSAVEMSEFSIT